MLSHSSVHIWFCGRTSLVLIVSAFILVLVSPSVSFLCWKSILYVRVLSCQIFGRLVCCEFSYSMLWFSYRASMCFYMRPEKLGDLFCHVRTHTANAIRSEFTLLSWLFLGSCVLMALGGSPFYQEFEQKWWSYLSTQVTSSLLTVFGYGMLWHRISSGCRWKPEGSCPQVLLHSFALRSPGRSHGAEFVVLPVLTGIPTLLRE